jgi:hypothetical protein
MRSPLQGVLAGAGRALPDMVTKRRRAEIRIHALRYLADHMQAVLDVDGPHDIVETDEEDAYLCAFVKDEAMKLRGRANRTKL